MMFLAENPLPHPIKRLLIANRGEIAVRIIRACRDEGIAPIAVYADGDRDALFVRMADEAYALQGDRPAQTYLDGDKLIAIAKRAQVDAVHPGYGFLSERADFAQQILDAGLIWVGPPPKVIAALGDKISARHIARAAGAPLVAGSDGPIADAAQACAFARQHGLPIVIKAAFGGGGRGMKVAWQMEEVADLFASARREAEAAFGRSDCFVEQFLDRPRHIEAQVIADLYGTVKVMGTRDCSLQRRNQKLVEEAPASFLSDELRSHIHASAQAICAHAGYSGAGTVEFLLSKTGILSFLEVNTRLQVEHPVTEETTGIDLVRAMIKVAEGARLMDDHVPPVRGHSFEFRINAEDSARGFLPVPGTITRWQPPAGPGVRLDSGVETGGQVSGHFDSLMAKLIITGATRAEALARARRALAEFQLEGVASVLPFHRLVLEQHDFTAENGAFNVHTRWIETDFADELAARLAPMARGEQPAPPPLMRMAIELDGKRHELALPYGLLAAPQGAALMPADAPPETAPETANGIIAPISGLLRLWQMPDGAQVNEGDVIAVMEAMKMETPIRAPYKGILRHKVKEGQQVTGGDLLAVVEGGG